MKQLFIQSKLLHVNLFVMQNFILKKSIFGGTSKVLPSYIVPTHWQQETMKSVTKSFVENDASCPLCTTWLQSSSNKNSDIIQTTHQKKIILFELLGR